MFARDEKDHTSQILKFIGFIFLTISVFIFYKTFFYVTKAEISYQVSRVIHQPIPVIPIDPDFSIIIPKLNINTKVVKNVDPFNSSAYQQALTQGVAHAKGSSLPGFPGNTFIFAHSANNWYQANQYNAIFYLINKLNPGDEIDLYYHNSKYTYFVSEKKIVAGNDIKYLSDSGPNQTLTLMTCWPPGTTVKRLVVLAHAQ